MGGRRPLRENRQASAVRVSREIKQHIDAVGANHLAHRVISQPGGLAPVFGVELELLRHLIRAVGTGKIGVAKHLDACPVMMPQQRQQEERAGVRPEIRRDIAHAQTFGAGQLWRGWAFSSGQADWQQSGITGMLCADNFRIFANVAETQQMVLPGRCIDIGHLCQARKLSGGFLGLP